MKATPVTDELLLCELEDGTWIVAQRLSMPVPFVELRGEVLDLAIEGGISSDEKDKLMEAIDDEAGITEHRW